jgi:putative ABC transport system ATP-binding protein
MNTSALKKDVAKNVIEVSNLNKTFKKGGVENHALKNLSLIVKDGEFISIEGPSGCGKSTLLSILSLLETPTSGNYSISGVQVDDISFSEKSRIRNTYMGIIFQNFNLIDSMTTLDNVRLPLTLRKKGDSKAKALILLNKVGLGECADMYPSELSGGQQQRVAIARALICDPEILFADEPTGNLDSENAKNVVNLFKALNDEGQTILMVTHDRTLAKLSSRNLNMLDGTIVNT